jgi:hydroxymethylglutaryl-CoA reductase
MAQVQIGLAGLLRINGAHDQGDFQTSLTACAGMLVASVSESQAGVSCAQPLDDGGDDGSTTLTALIVATCGGGTGVPVQQECREMLGCGASEQAGKSGEIGAGEVCRRSGRWVGRGAPVAVIAGNKQGVGELAGHLGAAVVDAQPLACAAGSSPPALPQRALSQVGQGGIQAHT